MYDVKSAILALEFLMLASLAKKGNVFDFRAKPENQTPSLFICASEASAKNLKRE